MQSCGNRLTWADTECAVGWAREWRESCAQFRFHPQAGVSPQVGKAMAMEAGRWAGESGAMTTSTFHDGAQRIRVSDAGELIAAVPAVLGFHPEDSLVLLGMTGRGELVAAARFDLEPVRVDGPARREVLRRFAEMFYANGLSGAVALLVDSTAAGHRADHEDLAEDFVTRMLFVCGVDQVRAFATPRIEAGQRWWTVHGESERGEVSDPAGSPVTAAVRALGRRVLGSRAELEQLLAPNPHRRDAVADLLVAAKESAELEYSLGVARDKGAGFRHRRLAGVLEQVDNHAKGEPLLSVELAELAVAVHDPEVRDALMGLADTELCDDAERLWMRLTRELPEPYCAEPAVLLAYSAYLRGDGSLASIAVDAAMQADPENHMAGLLGAALDRCIRPSALRELAAVGRRIAGRLGVALPEPIEMAEIDRVPDDADVVLEETDLVLDDEDDDIDDAGFEEARSA
jgi:hypothetical protein